MEQIDDRGQVTTAVHFTYATGEDGNSGWCIACMPKMTEFHATPYHPNYMRTNEPRAVTCPACKRAEPYRKAMQRYL